jgi:hypothetical protein
MIPKSENQDLGVHDCECVECSWDKTFAYRVIEKVRQM